MVSGGTSFALFGFLAIIIFGIFIFMTTDLITLFTTAGLTLDATASQGRASDRGVDASTGHFRGQGFKGQNPPATCLAVGQCPSSTTDQIIDSRNGISGGGGAPASTIGLSGFQTLFREDVLVFDSFHTPAKGQEITGAVLFEWGSERPITVTQVLLSAEFASWFDFNLPQPLAGEGLSFDGRSDKEFFYTLRIPENTLGEKFTVPVRFIVDTDIQTLDANALIEIETPQAIIDTFSFAEFFRSLFAFIRIGD